MLRLADHWVWDSWLAVAGEEFHLFFLRTSRALVAAARRRAGPGGGPAVVPLPR
ncbi:hypothetical protein AB0K00_04890 [Dactylosporangium sp. NPDC049525]|uniref:hypothetical protein n=1 Tax=Dactylosporangium sp. NPDC049525 TaxID=3154730 RepID=UPI0034348F86